MKRKYIFLFLFVLCLLFFSCKRSVDNDVLSSSLDTSESQDTLETSYSTYKEYLEVQFDKTAWTDGTNLLLPDVSMPYNLSSVDTELAYLYSQASVGPLIYGELDGIGELNYAGIPYDILVCCKNISPFIKQKSIDQTLVHSTRIFLQYFFPIVLSEFPEITDVFFGRPELAGDSFTVPFRLNFHSEDARISYLIVQATFTYETETWKLFEFEVGKVQYESVE